MYEADAISEHWARLIQEVNTVQCSGIGGGDNPLQGPIGLDSTGGVFGLHFVLALASLTLYWCSTRKQVRDKAKMVSRGAQSMKLSRWAVQILPAGSASSFNGRSTFTNFTCG